MELKEQFLRVRNGDQEAFARIYNELKRPVFTVSFRIVQSREAAEDITHDVFVKLYTSPPPSEVKNIRAWVFQMTRNLSLDVLKKKRTEDIDGVEIAAEDEIGAVAQRVDVERAISKLCLDEREIISLHLAGGLGFAEISRIVGISMPSAYRKYRKALSFLREYLGGTL